MGKTSIETRVTSRRRNAEASRERILSAAEKVFSDRGFEGSSMREIAAAAEVDVALINYHFGAKLQLYRDVFRRRIDGLTEQRLSGLEGLLSAARRKGVHPSLEDLVYCLVSPNIRLISDPALGGVAFARLIVREVTDPSEAARGIMSAAFDETTHRYLDALAPLFPDATRSELLWAYQFGISTLVLTMASTGRLEHLSRGSCNTTDPNAILERLVPFIVSGIRGCLRRQTVQHSTATDFP